MTEEYWQSWKKKRDLAQPNQIWRNIEMEKKVSEIYDLHPDQAYATCRADNNYWRHYRASTKLGIDELAMMICREVGCDL